MKRIYVPLSLLTFVALTAIAEPLPGKRLDGKGGEVAEYTFLAGPGMVIVRAEAMLAHGADDARLSVEIVDDEETSLLATVVEGDRSEQVLRRVLTDLLSEVATPQPVLEKKAARAKLDEAKTVTLRIGAGTGVASYTIRLSGALVFSEPEAEVDAVEETDPSPESEAAPAGDAVVTPTEPTGPIRIPGRKKTLAVPGKSATTPGATSSESGKTTPVAKSAPPTPSKTRIPRATRKSN